MFIVGSAIGPPTPQELNVDFDLQWKQRAEGRLRLTIEVRKSMNPHVTSVRALEDYQLEVSFENGERRIFDVKPFLSRGIFVRLQDRSLFQSARAVDGSVEWPGGLDLSYETLYLEGNPIPQPAGRDEQSHAPHARNTCPDVYSLWPDDGDTPGSRKYVASEMLLDAAKHNDIHLSVLVAETGLWAHPEVHAGLLRRTGFAAMFPNVRRARKGNGENRGQLVDGIRLDDNTYANVAIKRALGVHRLDVEGFEACHIWPLTCYDRRYHTAIANLVLLPRALAGLSDHDLEIQVSLQYRAYELYAWYPEGADLPRRPSYYPSEWRSPVSRSSAGRSRPQRRSFSLAARNSALVAMSDEERMQVIRRVREWAAKPNLNVHRIIGIVVRSSEGISRDELVKEAALITTSKNAYGAVASLLTSKANAYGRVLEDVGGIIRLHPNVAEEVRSFRWS
jgi:hypothetical protein